MAGSQDSFSTAERRFLVPFRRGFAKLTSPAVWLLAALHIPPNAVSLSQIAIGILIVFLMPDQPGLATALFFLTLVIDGLDGALARAYGQSSQFGALVDQISDHVRETLMIAALAFVGALHPVPAVMYGLVYALFNFLLFLCNYRSVPVPWAIKSYMVVYPGLILYGFFGVNWLTLLVSASVTLMTITIILALRNLKRVMS